MLGATGLLALLLSRWAELSPPDQIGNRVHDNCRVFCCAANIRIARATGADLFARLARNRLDGLRILVIRLVL